MFKHQKKFIFLFLLIFTFTPLFSYAFMTISPTNNIENINSKDDVIEENIEIPNLELENTQIQEDETVIENIVNPDISKSANDQPEIDSPEATMDFIIPDNGEEKIKEEKNNIENEIFKKEEKIKEESQESAIPAIIKMPKTFKKEVKDIKEEVEGDVKKNVEEKQEVIAVFGVKNIRDELNRNLQKKAEDLDTEKIKKEIEEGLKKYEESEEMREFARGIDATSTKNAIEEKRKQQEKEIAKALEKLKKEKAVEKCRKYYLSIIDSRINYFYNTSKVYEDRGDKLMIAFSLLKESMDVHPMVQSAMNEMNRSIKRNGQKDEYLMEKIYEIRDEVEKAPVSSSLYDPCRNVKGKFLKAYYYLGLLATQNREQLEMINRMKIVIDEFTKDKPFGKGFLLDLACIYDFDYVNSLPPEEYHYCNKENNRFLN